MWFQWFLDGMDNEESSLSDSSLSSSSSSSDQFWMTVLSYTMLGCSAAFIFFSFIQLLRISLRASKITKLQQDRARSAVAAGMNSVAVARVRFVGKKLFHICVIAAMAFKGTSGAVYVFGPCGLHTTWRHPERYCWPMQESLNRVENILLFFAYFDTFICWSEYLDSATSLLYGSSWGRTRSSVGLALRNRCFLAVAGTLLGAASVVYVVLLFLIYDENGDRFQAAQLIDLGAVTFVGILYLATAIGIAVQCARFMDLTKRVSHSNSLTIKSSSSSRLRAHSDADELGNDASIGTGSNGSLAGVPSMGSSGNLDREIEAAEERRRAEKKDIRDKVKLGSMFALIITCSVLLLVRAVYPVLVWLDMVTKIHLEDWMNLIEFVLCDVVPLVCMCAIVFPLPNENDVVGSSNGGSRIIVGTSVARPSDKGTAVNEDNQFLSIPADDLQHRPGSVNALYHGVDELESETDDDDDLDGRGDGSLRRSLLPQVAAVDERE